MKSYFKFIFLVTIAFSFLSCANKKKEESTQDSNYETVTVNGLYEIDVPNSMEEGLDLNEDASLQYQNLEEETYLVVIDENTNDYVELFRAEEIYNEEMDVLENYSNAMAANFLQSATAISYSSQLLPKYINSRPAQQIEFHANVYGAPIEVGYLLTFVEGESNMYMIMLWTAAATMDEHREEFVHIANSFREL